MYITQRDRIVSERYTNTQEISSVNTQGKIITILPTHKYLG